jgi:catechol 2,3-dioxygenase-like lactoylglutathione lyase family enzyme
MRVQAMTPMLRSWDILRAIAFYKAIGFRCVTQIDGFAALERDGFELMLSAPNAHEGDKAPGFTGSIYLRVDDVEAAWATYGGLGQLCYPIETFDYGMREFAIYDPDHYLLQFGQPVG